MHSGGRAYACLLLTPVTPVLCLATVTALRVEADWLEIRDSNDRGTPLLVSCVHLLIITSLMLHQAAFLSFFTGLKYLKRLPGHQKRAASTGSGASLAVLAGSGVLFQTVAN